MLVADAQKYTGTFRILPALLIPLSIWMIASPYFLDFTPWEEARIHFGLIGALVFGMALTMLAIHKRFWWVSLGAVALGLWLLLAPFIYGFSPQLVATVQCVVFGIIIILIGIVDALGRRS